MKATGAVGDLLTEVQRARLEGATNRGDGSADKGMAGVERPVGHEPSVEDRRGNIHTCTNSNDQRRAGLAEVAP
jgi:hypothetical protein